jgi:hypothetical protein
MRPGKVTVKSEPSPIRDATRCHGRIVGSAHTQSDINALFEQIDRPIVKHFVDAQMLVLIEERLQCRQDMQPGEVTAAPMRGRPDKPLDDSRTACSPCSASSMALSACS